MNLEKSTPGSTVASPGMIYTHQRSYRALGISIQLGTEVGGRFCRKKYEKTKKVKKTNNSAHYNYALSSWKQKEAVKNAIINIYSLFKLGLVLLPCY